MNSKDNLHRLSSSLSFVCGANDKKSTYSAAETPQLCSVDGRIHDTDDAT